MTQKIKFNKKFFDEGMTFTEYFQLVEKQVFDNEKQKVSGALANYLKLGYSRMKRLIKKAELNDNILRAAEAVNEKQNWLIITEGWCGDAAQNIPYIEKAAEHSNLITSRYILRDDNEVIDSYLTNGGKSIPKLIAFDEDQNELFTWGPRPQNITELVQRLKAEEIPKDQIAADLQKAYNKDKGKTVLNELSELLHYRGAEAQ